MALPLTGISVSLVRNTIGAGSNDVGTLFLHPNVNEYGFNNPDPGIQSALWGSDPTYRESLSPNSVNYQQVAGYKPGYHLHAFRGYDHDWVTYQYSDFYKTGNEYYLNMVFTYKIEVAAIKLSEKPDPDIFLQFRPQYRRTVLDSWIDMDMFTIATSNKEATFIISAQNPPDFSVNGALDQEEQFQVRVVIINPSSRRWTEQNKVSPILVITTPTSLHTNAKYVAGEGGYVVEQTTPIVLKQAALYGDVYADLPNNGSAVISGYISDTSSFTNKYYPASNANVNIPKSTTPGSVQYAGHFELDFSATNIFDVVGVGSTVYCRLFMDGVQVSSFNVIVTNTPPEM